MSPNCFSSYAAAQFKKVQGHLAAAAAAVVSIEQTTTPRVDRLPVLRQCAVESVRLRGREGCWLVCAAHLS